MARKKSLFYGNRGGARPHLTRNRDIGGEVAALRSDVEQSMLTNGGMLMTEEFTDATAAVANHFKTTSATSLSPTTPALANTLVPGNYERNVTVTLSSATGAYTTDPIEVDIVDQWGEAHTLTFTPANADGGATLQSNEGYGARRVTEIRIPAQADTDGAITVGFGAGFGLKSTPKVRAGTANVLRQITSGTGVVTTGAFLGRRFIPAAAPNGTLDYAVMYEVDSADA